MNCCNIDKKIKRSGKCGKCNRLTAQKNHFYLRIVLWIFFVDTGSDVQTSIIMRRDRRVEKLYSYGSKTKKFRIPCLIISVVNSTTDREFGGDKSLKLWE